MAEAETNHNLTDDVVIIPDTPSPVFSKRTTSIDFKRRQLPFNISPVRGSGSPSTHHFSPPGGALSLPDQESFAREREQALRRKKSRDKFSSMLGSSGLSPVKRLSPDKAGFVKSSALLNNKSQSDQERSPMKKVNTAQCMDRLKRDVSPLNMCFSPCLYDRIKSKQKNKVHNRQITNPSGQYGWPSDSDSSDDELLASAVDSCENEITSGRNKSKATKITEASCSKKFPDSVVFLDNEIGINTATLVPIKKKICSKSATRTSAESPEKVDTLNKSSFTGQKYLSHNLLPEKRMSNKPVTSAKLLNKMFQSHSSPDKHKSKHGCKRKHPDWCGAVSNSSSLTSESNRNYDKQISPGLASLTALCSDLSSQTGTRPAVNQSGTRPAVNQSGTRPAVNQSGTRTAVNALTGSRISDNNSTASSRSSGTDSFARRLERKRKHETQSERGSTKIANTERLTQTKSPVIKSPVIDRISVSSEDATPETRKVINAVSQLEKDEEIARQLQEELDREFALHLQDQSEAVRSRSETPDTDEQDYRYHSPFGDIGHHRIDSPSAARRQRRRGRSPVSHDWHLFDPAMAASVNRTRGEIPALELEELMADAASSFHAGLEYELTMGGGRRRGGRRARGGRAAGVFNLMFNSPNTSGNDYEALMQLGEVLGDAKQKGLSKNDLQRLPTTLYKADENNPSTECHICMGDYEEGESLKILPCFHSYHVQCIDKWIKQNATCPVCRVEIRL